MTSKTCNSLFFRLIHTCHSLPIKQKSANIEAEILSRVFNKLQKKSGRGRREGLPMLHIFRPAGAAIFSRTHVIIAIRTADVLVGGTRSLENSRSSVLMQACSMCLKAIKKRQKHNASAVEIISFHVHVGRNFFRPPRPPCSSARMSKCNFDIQDSSTLTFSAFCRILITPASLRLTEAACQALARTAELSASPSYL